MSDLVNITPAEKLVADNAVGSLLSELKRDTAYGQADHIVEAKHAAQNFLDELHGMSPAARSAALSEEQTRMDSFKQANPQSPWLIINQNRETFTVRDAELNYPHAEESSPFHWVHPIENVKLNP